jgi:excisionase family DNA binding protein
VLLTVKDLSEQLQIKPATLYAWAAQDKIPCLKIHRVLRFEPEKINEWLKTFGFTKGVNKVRIGRTGPGESVEALIARAKREVYSSSRGNQTNSEPTRREETWGS